MSKSVRIDLVGANEDFVKLLKQKYNFQYVKSSLLSFGIVFVNDENILPTTLEELNKEDFVVSSKML